MDHHLKGVCVCVFGQKCGRLYILQVFQVQFQNLRPSPKVVNSGQPTPQKQKRRLLTGSCGFTWSCLHRFVSINLLDTGFLYTFSQRVDEDVHMTAVSCAMLCPC